MNVHPHRRREDGGHVRISRADGTDFWNPSGRLPGCGLIR